MPKHNPTIPNTFEFKLLLDRLFLEQKEKLNVLFNSVVCDVHSGGGRIERDPDRGGRPSAWARASAAPGMPRST